MRGQVGSYIDRDVGPRDRSSDAWPDRNRSGEGRPPSTRSSRPATSQLEQGGGPRPGKPKVPLWATLCLVFGAVTMVASGGIVVGPPLAQRLFLPDDINDVAPIPEDIRGKDIDGAINFLLLGMDNPDVPGQTDRRADSIVLVHIPSTHDVVYMISFPRDTRVVIPAYPATGLTTDWESKINSAFFVGTRTTGSGPSVWEREADLSPEGRARGAEVTMRAINNLVPGGLGLEFHGWATIDFEGFEAVVEALGGVYLCIDSDFYSIHYYPDGTPAGNPLWGGLNDEPAGGPYGSGYHYTVGCRHLEPWQALDYSRQRYGLPHSDYDRQRHQQQLLKAIVKKVASTDTLTNINTINRLREAAGDMLTLNLGGHDLIDWVWTLKSLRADDIVMIKTNGGTFCDIPGSSDQCLTDDMLDLLRAVKNETVFEFLTAHPDWVATDQ
jgi:anionic cell wall polymer biosynthesis LytR-Cps2A-Psr (LCP) family protein